MATTVSTLVDLIAFELKDTAHTNYSLLELYAYINKAVRVVVRHLALTNAEFWLSTSESQLDQRNLQNGVSDYPMPTGWLRTILVRTTDGTSFGEPLDPIGLDQSNMSNARGYLFLAGQLRIRPEPSADVVNGLEHYYVALPTAVAALTDVVLLGDYFGDFYSQFAVALGRIRQEENPAAIMGVVGLLKKQVDQQIAMTNLPQDIGPELELHTTI